MAIPTPPFLDPVEEMRARIMELEAAGTSSSTTEEDLIQAKRELAARIDTVFSNLSPWQQCQLARHPERPYTMAYIHSIFSDFTELHGDRGFADDPAIVAGLARFQGEPVIVLGHQKGRDTAEKLRRNFGMPRPEGYRKAIRIMKIGAQFRRPIICFIDTPGAYPGIDAEQRGQAEAIANNLVEMAGLPVPIVVIVTGEGGSGGALALGIGDRILMLEHSIYSVISPEGCAAILWKDQARAEDAAQALRLTATDLKRFGIIDEIIPEPPGGAQMDPGLMAETITASIHRNLKTLRKLKPDSLVTRRYKKFRSMGIFSDR
jgi:acetyl-CoA carboxylase carboxyl transferase subunit alpha